MKYSEIVSDLKSNNAKLTGFYTTEQLLEIFNKASFDVPNIGPYATTLTYSGPLDTGYTWQIAEPIGVQSAGEIRTIGNTDVSKLLNDSNMRRALLKANNYDEEIVRNILDGEYSTDQNGNRVRIKPGWTDIMSERFVLAAKGPLVSLTPNADPTRVWGLTELDAALRSSATTINGIPREDLIRARNNLTQTTGSESQAKAILLDYVNELSVEHTSLLSTYVDGNGKIISHPATQHALHVETKQFFERLGIQAPGTELPDAPNKTRLLNAESRLLMHTDQFRNAQIAHRIIQQDATERLRQAKAAGDVSRLATASRYLDRLGMIGDVISLSLLASEANAAYAKGDKVGAQRIVENGLVDYTGGLLGSLLAANLTGSLVAPLVFFGPGGALLAGTLTVAASVLGGMLGSAALGQLVASFKERTADKAAEGTILRDPLAFDLDGDGIETIGLRDGKPILFDHDGDGIKTGTGWLKSDDAWLVLDRNSNGTIDTGRELFGVDTLKSTNMLATDGFDALRDLDSNNDEKIDQADRLFSQLRLWRDNNQDGISQIGELSTLNANGIISIGLKSTASSINLGNGNIQTAAGVFSRSDGTTGNTGLLNGTSVNLDLVINSFYRKFTDQIALTDQASKLPALLGSGQVRDLPEAISRSPELGRLVESYLLATNRQDQRDMLDGFLEKWADTSSMKSLKAQATALAGNNVNLVYSLAGLSPGTSDYEAFLRKLGIVERFMGFTYGGPIGAARFTPLLAGSGVTSVTLNSAQVESILMAYDMFKNDLYQSLLFHSRLQGYVNKIAISFSNDKILLDATGIVNSFKNAIATNARDGIIDLIDFICAAGPTNLEKLNWNIYEFLFDELNNTPELGVFSDDLIDLSVRFAGPAENRLSGSSRPDLLVGTLGSDTLIGGAGNDILHGKVGNDFLYGDVGDDILHGGSGNDTINGDAGNDSIVGGDGNDLITDNSGINTLVGGSGNDIIRSRGTFAGGSGDDLLQATDVWFGDTYLFQLGDGKDVINDFGLQGTDTISFGAGINPTELPLHRVGLDLRFQVNANDQLSVKDWFTSSHQYIEQFRFSNGTVWNVDTILSTPIISAGSANADNLVGWHGIDSLDGGGGNDTLDGANGNDIILGGDGNDLITDNSGINTLVGGAGNDIIRSRGTFAGGSGDDLLQATDIWFGDTYLFQLGDGKDVINDFGLQGTDTISFGAGINPTELPLHRVGLDLRFQVNANDQLSVKDWFTSSHQYIEQFRFSNGTVWNVDTILSTPIISAGSANADNLVGWHGIDSLDGGGGNDTLDGANGNDIILGGDGNDLITDNSGINTLVGGAGNDIIRSRGTFAGGSGDDLLQATDIWFGDTYLFQTGDGKDVINDFGLQGTDTISFGAGINPTELPLHRVGLDLRFQVNANDQLFVKDWFASSHQYIEQFRFSNGTVWNVDTILSTPIISAGSANADYLVGWHGIDSLDGGGGNDTLDGANGNDIILGGDGNDLITDTSGINSLRGGAGNDIIRSRGTFAGGSGDDLLQATDIWFGDTYLFQTGDGKDVINDFGLQGTDTISFGAGINPTELPLHRVGSDLRFQVNANDQLSVKDWFTSSHQYIEQFRFSNGTVWNVDTILSTPIISAGSANADNLVGWHGIDSLDGGGGNDTLDGANGNDIILGGDGNDLITDNSGINTLVGGAGNDIIRSRGTFAGGSGDDLLQATDIWFGDTYLFQIGDGKDVINDLGFMGTDTIIFGGGINASMLWFQKSGPDLEVTRIGSIEGVRIQNWYTSSSQQIERLRSADGKVLSNTNVDALVKAMAAFDLPSVGQTTLSGNYLSALNPVITANWL